MKLFNKTYSSSSSLGGKQKGVAFIAMLLCSIFIFPGKSYATKDSSKYFKIYEDSLKALQFGRMNPNNTDQQRADTNALFLAMMKRTLGISNSFDYPFDSLNTIGKVTSPDKQFRIINWNMPKADGTQEYFGFIQSMDQKTKKYVVYPLIDKSSEITNPANVTYTADKWLGMLYYKIIAEKVDNKMTYILLAWQGYNKLITRKIIDFVSFNNSGAPSFGKAAFSKLPSEFKGTPKRLIFQYAQTAVMSLRYDPKTKTILFDKMGPNDPSLTGQYQYYGPSFQIDGLTLSHGVWEYKINVDARNPASAKDNQYKGEKDGDIGPTKKPIYSPKSSK